MVDSPCTVGVQPRVSSPSSTGSTLMTSAPSSPRYWPHSGPASTLEKSTAFNPAKGCIIPFLPERVCPSFRLDAHLDHGVAPDRGVLAHEALHLVGRHGKGIHAALGHALAVSRVPRRLRHE